MSTQDRTSFIDEGFDTLQTAWSNVEDEFGRLQKRFEKRRKKLEKDASKQVTKLRKLPIVKRVESIREDAQKQIEENVQSFLGLLPIASSSEVKRLERRITQLTRRVKALEKETEETSEPVRESA